MPPKRKSLTIQQKFDIVDRLERGVSNADLCKELGLSSSTVSTIWKARDKIKESFETNHAKQKKLRGSQYEDVDEALLTWFKVQRSKNISINGPMLLEKAQQYAASFSHESTPYSSWVQRFRMRHNIIFGQIGGESSSAPTGPKEEWLEIIWPKLREGYSDDDIYNADETGLFYKVTPDKTFKFKGEKCSGGKMSKDRVTVMVAANKSGTDKRKLLVIGKSKNPRCFKNTNINRLPASYTSNKTAWMTSTIFEKFLRDWDEELGKKNKKILLLVENCPAHPKVKGLKNIKLAFLPANTASILQPMDRVIYCMKRKFRKRLLIKIIKKIEKNEPTDVNVLDAIIMISGAWAEVTKETIQNCFRHAGFESAVEEETPSGSSDADEDINAWARDLDLPQSLLIEDLNEYVSVDDNLTVASEMADGEILSAVQQEGPGADEEDHSDDEDEAPPLATHSDAAKGLENIYRYLSSKSEVPGDVDDAVKCIEKFLDAEFCAQRKKQSKMTDYFSPD